MSTLIELAVDLLIGGVGMLVLIFVLVYMTERWQ